MADFIKLFRRQRSKQGSQDKKGSSVDDKSFIRSESASNFEDSQINDTSISSEFCGNRSSSFSVLVEEKSEDTFKEPKSWRKSLRKLKWKKRDQSVSVSSDNISRFPSDIAIASKAPSLISPSRLSKRWSYSPDLCEENVPGAKELRGTLERKLSIKHEVDERQHAEHPYRSMYRKKKEVNERSDSSYGEYHDCDDRQTGATFSSFCSPNNDETFLTPIKSLSFFNNSVNSQALSTGKNIQLSQSHPTLLDNSCSTDLSKQDYISSEHEGTYSEEPMRTTEDEFTHTSQSITSLQASSSSQLSSGETGTPEEDDIPYDLEDIDEVLANAESRSSTLVSLHGQQGVYDQLDRDGNPLRPLNGTGFPTTELLTSRPQSMPGSMTRGQVMTQFERTAEGATERLDNNANQQTDHHDVPVSHYYKQLNDSNDNRISAITGDPDGGNSDCAAMPGSDDNISWDSNEFDSTSDESETEAKRGQDKRKDSNKSARSGKDIGKEVQKLKFWERTSLKKKSVPKAPEPEPSLFVDFHIPADRRVLPQLPELAPADLTENQLKRRRIVGTIISSEQSYIESLQRLETDYKQVLLEAKPPLIAPDMIEKIFHKIPAILQCHRLFQMALASAAMSWDTDEAIGGTFVASFSKSMVLECYGDFINNFTTAMDAVRKTCLRKPQFLAFLRDRQNESKDRLNLYGLMLKPVQRFPQFIMLVQDLLKHTPPSHADRLQLQLALTELETLADRLNKRKAHEEDASDLRNLMENSNLKLSSHTKSGRPRRLVKQGDVRECEHNDDGLLEKVKDCLLILTNDMLICCSINNRKPHQRGNSSTYKDMYKLKWRVGLDVVEITDGSTRRNNNKIERESLHSDFITLQQINRLIDSLKLPHEGVSTQIIDKCISDLEIKIRQAEQVATQPEESSFAVKFPGKSDTIVTRTLVLTSVSLKNEWLETISRAKLANSPSNLDSWFSADGGDGEMIWDPPLFLRSFSAHMSYETLQVQCAYSFMPTCHVSLLWLSCAASTVLAVVSVYHITEDRVEKVHVMQVESSVQCMEHWNPFNGTYSVWLGMESGCLLEYSADGSYRKLCEVVMPTMSTVMIMKAHRNNLYVGLLDGTLAMYSRQPDTTGLQHISSIMVGTGPLVCLSPVEGKLWGCSGNNVVTICMENFQAESSRSLLMEGEDLVVSLVTRVGSGLWVTFCNDCNLNLYHLESLDRLQEINLSRVIRDFVQGLDQSDRLNDQCHITSMWSGHSQLLVGTSNGLLLAMPLPKLPGSVPKITGPCKICRHGLLGPLTFLFSPELPHAQVCEKALPSFLGEESAPPPVPRRDDLDATIVPEQSEEADKNTTLTDSRRSPCPPFPSSPRSAPKYREVPPPSYVRQRDLSPRSPHSPPSTSTPRPSVISDDIFDPRRPSLSCEQWLENGSLYSPIELKSIESPSKLTFINWNENSSRHCPVVLACGEGYRKFNVKNSKVASEPVDNHSPTILCWKVVTT